MYKHVFLSARDWKMALYNPDILMIGKILFDKGHLNDKNVSSFLQFCDGQYARTTIAKAIALVSGGPCYIHNDGNRNMNLNNWHDSYVISFSFPVPKIVEWQNLAGEKLTTKEREKEQNRILNPLRTVDPGVELYEGQVDAIFKLDGIRIWIAAPYPVMYRVLEAFFETLKKLDESIRVLRSTKQCY